MKLNINKKAAFDKYLKKYSYNLEKIVGIDPNNINSGESYLLDNGVLSKISNKDVKQEHLLSSYIPNKNVITYEFQIQKNLLDKIELDDYIETKCYEDVGLDEAEEYIFKYKLVDNDVDEKNVLVETVIVPKKDFSSFFEPVVNQYGYLDFITYPGFVFNILYTDQILDPRNDLYIYFTHDEIIITLYSEGKFLQTSIIPEGLENIYTELVDSIKIKNFNFDLFMQLIVKKGLDLNNYADKEHVLFNELSELFSNKFLMISTQLHSIIRKFSLTTIDRIFMGTPKGVIPGISEFANMYLGVEANDLKFDMNYNPDNIEIDQILFLSMLYAQAAYKKSYQIDNFTLFKRPPTFFYRKSGQFISITVASIILSSVYPIYQIIDTYFIESSNQEMQQKLNNLKRQNKKLSKQNKDKKDMLKSKKSEKNNLIKYIKDRKTIINTIYLEKKGYAPKALLLSNIVKYLIDNKVYVKDVMYGKAPVATPLKLNNNKIVIDNQDDNYIMLSVYARDSKNITKFIDSVVKSEHLILSTPGYNKINNFYTAKIMIKVEK